MRDPLAELAELEAAGLRRQLRTLDSPQGVRISLAGSGTVHNFSSNDYLGFATEPIIAAAFAEHLQRLGHGAGASRLVCGSMAAHRQLEEQLADLKRSEAALTFSSGFAVATGVLPALCGKGDVIILDKLCHASLIDGARLSGATLRIFPHNDLDRLERHLRWASETTGPDGRILVVTESVFSMDGDTAPLVEICRLKDESEALLLVDEAHAFGVFGPAGRGLAAALGLESRIDLQMGTFSKALGLSGGYLCASRAFVDLLINRARSFIYSTAPAPALAATLGDALQLMAGPLGDDRRGQLWRNCRQLEPKANSAIIPHIIGTNEAALAAAESLLHKGFLVPAIRYPTVPRGSARLRVTLSAKHESDQVQALQRALSEIALTSAL